MKVVARLCAVLVALTMSANILAYQQQTHSALSDQAFQAAEIFRQPGFYTGTSLWPLLGVTSSLANELFSSGAYREDDGNRSPNHFFDPVNNAGLSVAFSGVCTTVGMAGGFTCEKSPDWALAGKNQQADQAFSFELALSQYYYALTSGSIADRQANSAGLFITLGHVAHHIQDMAQPQHTRNDIHCDDPRCKAIGLYDPSRYEAYVNKNTSAFFARSIEPVYSQDNKNLAFVAARDFWSSTIAVGGLSRLSNTLFVSEGTNFEFCAFVFYCAGKYSDPNPADTKTIPFTDSGIFYVIEYPVGSGRYISSIVPDGESSYGFALTDVNYSAAATYLIPQAINYSAGFINFFFRGRIEASSPPDPCASNTNIRFTNLGPDLPAGVFEGFYDDSNGVRRKVDRLSYITSGLKSGQSIETSLAVDNSIIQFLLVFRPVSLCGAGSNCPSLTGSGVVAWGKGTVGRCPFQ